MVCAFIALKFENSYHINLHDIASVVGHDKFSKHEIIKTELDILKSIQFRVQSNTLIEEVHKRFKEILLANAGIPMKKQL